MPELPDVTVYVEALGRLFAGETLRRIDLRSPFLVRSVEPDLLEAQGQRVLGFRRIGKRIVWELEGDRFLVFHLMIAGRFHRRKTGTRPRGKNDLAAFHFDRATLMLTEAGTRKRASLHLVRGERGLAQFHRGGLDVLDAGLPAFRRALQRENHTLKRALTDPRLFDGIGNACSDEILHAARLSPFKQTRKLAPDDTERLYRAACETLLHWIERSRAECGDGFPEKVTAFRAGMAVHGRYGQPCPVCGTRVQRVVYAENEMNYCPRCQTGGKVLADRSLSRLLKDDWPRTIDELEGS